MDWQPISEYDALPIKRRPKLAAFLFSEVPAKRPGGYKLDQMVRMERTAGHRTCTHFPPLPEPPK